MAQVPYVAATYTTTVTAAQLNHLEQGVNDVSYAPCVRVFHNATQSITNNTPTILAFNSERFDTAGNAADTMHDTVTNNGRLTCRYAGKYQITANVAWASNPTSGVIELVLNVGVTVIAAQWVTGNYNYMQCTTLYDLAVNDYVQVRVTQGSGGALNVSSSANYSPEFMMVRVG